VSTQDFVVPVYQQLDSPKLVLTAVSGNGSFSPLAYQLGTCVRTRTIAHAHACLLLIVIMATDLCFAGVDFIGMRYGGNGTYNISAGISVVANVGCDPSDYDSVTPNSIALIQRGGTCTFYGKGASHPYTCVVPCVSCVCRVCVVCVSFVVWCTRVTHS
jgi:hypothetical protein